MYLFFFKHNNIKCNSFTQSYTNADYPINFISNSINIHSLNDSNNNTLNNNFYNEHTYHANISFTKYPNIQIPLNIKQQQHTMLQESINANSNIYNISLMESISIQNTINSIPTQDYFSSNTTHSNIKNTPYNIITIEHILINKEDTTYAETKANTNNIDDANNGVNTHNIENAKINDSQINTANTINNTLFSNKNQTTIFNSKQYITNQLNANSIISHTNIFNNNNKELNHFYSNTITLLPSHISFTPSIKPKPIPPFNTQGIVIGEGYTKAKTLKEANDSIQKEANTIYNDSYGRIKVRLNTFYAYALLQESLQNKEQGFQEANNIDSKANTQEQIHMQTNTRINTQKYTQEQIQQNAISTQSIFISHTPFLRVISPIASKENGFFALPRVGDEVIISYLDNDIDKPYISGSLYNMSNPSLVAIHNIHQTSLSSKTIGTQENGINELTLSNLKDHEEIYIHAQKDYKKSINNNFNQTIHNNKDSVVKGSYTESITKSHTQTIQGLKNVMIGAEYLTNVALSKDTIVGLSHTLNIGADNKLRVANNSSEYIGGNRSVEIGGKLQFNIERYKLETINDNATQIVQGYNNIQTNKDLQIDTQGETLLQSHNNIHVNTNQSLSLNADVNMTMLGDRIHTIAQNDIYNQAQNKIIHQIGNTIITATSDSVTIKAGGVDVIIDSNGFMVKGGEIKSE